LVLEKQGNPQPSQRSQRWLGFQFKQKDRHPSTKDDGLRRSNPACAGLFWRWSYFKIFKFFA